MPANLALRWQSLLRLTPRPTAGRLIVSPISPEFCACPERKNCKDPANPKPVAIHCQTDRRYNPSDFAEFLEAHGIPNAEEQERASAGMEGEGRRQATVH